MAPANAESPAGKSPAGDSPSIGRRSLLTGGAVGVGIGTLLGIGGTLGLQGSPESVKPVPTPGATDEALKTSLGTAGKRTGFGGEALPCHGSHQPGVTMVPGAHIRYIAYTLKPETDAAALQRMFRILTGDVEGLTSGAAPLADPEPELAARPARLSITIGVGSELVQRINKAKVPKWLGPLPAFSRDQLDGRHDGGDLVLILQADDQLAVAHAARMLERDLRSFAELHWVQQGFRQARGSESTGTTMRNLMGQVDGTVNPDPSDDDFAGLVWCDGSGEGETWLKNGSALVLRRTRMELDTWDMVDRPGREQTIGRTLSDGAPLSGGTEHTPSDFDAKNALGLPVIPTFSHIRRARSEDPNERIFRRGMNYDDGQEAGLLFACYQRNPLKQFVPIQQRLDELDLLNEWVTHTGSAVFAILPGFKQGEQLGASLLA
ncbi:Dyp-type peroxidase [Leucobacter coleopterorum]|uniref:Dyp-type peroxidase n=2 Tax=Leucobacter coleopterorum TaxID=2714933 RepID=A0ABX6K3B6_9MICO|nr:Dyp-type peroxidase [Leucobacter coleopterorum]